MRKTIIEQIARQWFERETSTNRADWDNQPESVREVFRALAAQFWSDPGKLTRELQSVAISTRQITITVDRATKAWIAAQPVQP